ncbi:endonuclease MutS2 [Synechococcus sp. RSCCF101]|uniref:endonuclease MutS2 n=1 Tax=Synechococcus sp. RSCCF101 TaxID=2511069 RepID=UPI0012482DB4|nr:endonuclease MutS2 [Synechococcus sp. RSCCF101]QEY33549.1 endonuclease MutS2 [Synechococcus sp. RSCCF101]
MEEALALLEWPRLLEHLAHFAGTAAGRDRCLHLQLPGSLEASQARLSETRELLALDGLLEGGLSFDGVVTLTPLLDHCEKEGTAQGEDLLALAGTLGAGRRLRRQILDPELRPVCSALVEPVASLPELEQRLRFCLEEGGRLADRASPDLAAVRLQLEASREQRRQRLQEVMRRHASILQDTVISERRGRPVLAVKAGAQSQLAGLVHDSSASGQTVFIEPQALVPLGNRIRDLESREREEEQKLLRQLSGLVATHVPALRRLQDVLEQLDAGTARACYSQWIGGVPPVLESDPQAPFQLRGLRHPLLLWQQRRQGGAPVVPVDLQVSAAIRVVAITGPNTGGKTVTLKSVGLVALMARAGLFLPCHGTASLPWCAQVLADIGDEQSLQQNLSTFSGHIRRISRILAALAASTAPALVLLDEVGAGTDPSEGAALATALLRHLAGAARLTIATTHFGELKALKYNDERFENASVAFDDDTLSPTYHLQWGIPGRSNALAIAARLGLDSAVVDAAGELLAPAAVGEVNAVIAGLEDQRQRQQEAAEEAAALLMRAELLHEELMEGWRRQQHRTAEQQQEGRRQLEDSIRSGQKEVRRIIRRLREGTPDGEQARQAGQRLKRLQQQHRPHPERRDHSGWRPVPGERVRVLSLGKAAEVLELVEGGRQLVVRCGVMRMTVELSAIEALDGRRPAPPDPPAAAVQVRHRLPATGAGPQVRTAANTIDVRGLRVHEAEAMVEEQLRHARGPLWVIHGIGTGRLKRGLRSWLDTVPYVERVSDAEPGDGGTGCSVIWPR